jgi:hypothetical protein
MGRWHAFGCAVMVTGLLAAALLAGGSVTTRPDKDTPDEQLLARAKVGTDGAALLAFLKKQTHTVVDQDQIQALVRQLGAAEFPARERASAGLLKAGRPAAALLRQALKSSDHEVARRAATCLKAVEAGPGAREQAAAVRLVARRQPAGAAAVLLAYLPCAPNDAVAEEVRSALAAVAKEQGKPDPALRQALADPIPVKRAAAAEALCRAEVPGYLAAVRPLLADDDPEVRLRVAQALAARGEKSAVPVLIDLLDRLPPMQLAPIEDILYRLAGEEAPAVVPGDSTTPAQVRANWARWWRAHEASVDLTKLAVVRGSLGYTLVVQANSGRVEEVDADGKLRWQIRDLVFPLAAEVVGDDRVLIAEYRGNRVTERTFQGTVVWEKKVACPIAAQRLPGGRTFIATRSQLLELDRDGSELFHHDMPGQILMASRRLPSGHIVCITSGGLCLRLDATGKEVHRFQAGIGMNFGLGLDVSPAGHILIPQYRNHKVVEYSADGKILAEVPVRWPDSAFRLPGGTTLVASQVQRRVMELDRDGNVVWQYSPDGTPTRATRR